MMFEEGFKEEADVFREFDLTPEERIGVGILYACYDISAYEGQAFVVFRRDGKIYEVNGSHCSCMGLEGQWEPEETTVRALLARPNVPENAKQILRNVLQVTQ